MSNNYSLPKECIPCVVRQAESASKFAGLNMSETELVKQIVEKEIEKSNYEKVLPQQIARKIADKIIELKNKEPYYDIYKNIKKISNDLTLKYYEKLKNKIEKSDNRLEMGLQTAAAGNIIDFGAKDQENLDIEYEIENLHLTDFARFDFSSLKEKLKSAESLLYICDNAGEIVFDKILMKILSDIYPQLRITAAVRDKPIINDADLFDAEYIGLSEAAETISSGSVYPGTILSETSDEFMTHYKNSDIILSKGQGNFETLFTENNENLFFLLRIKCPYMSRLSGVREGSLVLINSSEINS